jgi:hypothetical protein
MDKGPLTRYWIRNTVLGELVKERDDEVRPKGRRSAVNGVVPGPVRPEPTLNSVYARPTQSGAASRMNDRRRRAGGV